MNGWNTVKDGLKWSIGDGRKTSVWNDRWLPNNLTLREMINGPLTYTDDNIRVSDLLTNSKQWNYNRLSVVLPEDIKNLFECVYIPYSSNTHDKASWSLNFTGILTKKLCTTTLKTPTIQMTNQKEISIGSGSFTAPTRLNTSYGYANMTGCQPDSISTPLEST